jgi:large subunit ribosomal protein L33
VTPPRQRRYDALLHRGRPPSPGSRQVGPNRTGRAGLGAARQHQGKDRPAGVTEIVGDLDKQLRRLQPRPSGAVLPGPQRRKQVREFSWGRFLDFHRPVASFQANPIPISRTVMAKAVSTKIKLISSADTGFYYVTKKNSRTMTEKLKMKKYDPIAKKHVEFVEGKIK